MQLLWIIVCISATRQSSATILRLNRKEPNYRLTLLGAASNSSNKDLCEVGLTISTVSRGVHLASGFMDIKVDFDDNEFVEFRMSYSRNGNSEYKRLPFKYNRNTFTNAVNGPYKTFLMKPAKACAPNAPQFKYFWKPPLKAGLYESRNCAVTAENFPSYMPSGYYKIMVLASGIVGLYFELTFEVEGWD